ncbi:Rossmann-like domain-containing protein [Desulfobacterium sp. N47]|uniref:Putative heavy-metal chelation domain-containing protein n=1 Tax=uncultured Desulfobacterium sp. TaxID=201089 RepID=E1YCL5_9BACT|nr:hypothetical protein N47_G36330 [uncultured Desulfobacterium sp.]
MSLIRDELKKRFFDLCLQNNLLEEYIDIYANTLTSEEAIGNPEDKDFPLLKGKERLMQAEFRGSPGQAFTDQFGNFKGTLGEILSMPLNNNYRRAVFTATLNAVTRSLGVVKGTLHCRDKEPGKCAVEMVKHIKQNFGTVKITQVGFQPVIAREIASLFPLRLLDLDTDNIGTKKSGVVAEGPDKTDEALKWADVLLVTGTTLVNDSIGLFLTEKPVIFYGTTIAGAAYLMGWNRFCPKSL